MYQIVDLSPESRLDTEQLGSKPKFWVQVGEDLWLFKEARPNTGEDWAEKAAAEIARLIGVASAEVELARFGDTRGCISRNFIAVDQGEALVHGNEILARRVTGYEKTKRFRQQDHTLENIQRAIHDLFPGPVANDVLTQLASYLVLDGLIGNTDRHHENWGLRVRVDTQQREVHLSVAPSFDHASSLGRELLDARRARLLAAKQVGRYVSQGRGGIFRDADQGHGENPLRLVQVAAEAYPEYFRRALEQVAAVPDGSIHAVFAALPSERASDMAKEFAEEAVLYAKRCLKDILIK